MSSDTLLRVATETSTNAALARSRDALCPVARPMLRIRVLRRSTHLAIMATDAQGLILRQQHVLSRLGKPAIDEVAVSTIARTGRELQRRRAGPTLRQPGPEVVADAEAKLGHALHTGRAAVRRPEVARPVLRARIRRVKSSSVCI